MREKKIPRARLVLVKADNELRPSPPAPAPAPARARGYLAAYIAATVLSVVLFCAALGVLRAMDRLPPTPVSGMWCIDSRFTWLREHPDWKNAQLLAVGSAATFRNLDFGVVSQERGVVNAAAPCFLTMNQSRYLTEFLVQRASRLETVMMVLAPRDFQGCSRNPAAFFNPDLVDRFIAGEVNKAWLRFRNFSLKDIFFHAIYADERRPQLQYDKFGSGPLMTGVPDTGQPVALEPGCYSELRRLAGMLEAKGIQFIAVTFPVMQGWAERHDRSGVRQAQFRSAIESALAPTKAILVDGMAHWRAPDSSFTDPVQLQWPETAAFTRFVWQEARQQGAELPPLGEIAIATPMADAIFQNTSGQSEGYAAGVPKEYVWCSGSYKPAGNSAPPSNFTAVTGKGQVYPKAGVPADSGRSGTITIANTKTWVHLGTTRKWVLVQDQATDKIAGSHYVSDFTDKAAKWMNVAAQPDGSAVIATPPAGYNDHFWPSNRGTFAARSVDGVYVQLDMRVNDPNMKLVANIGADWWLDEGAGFMHSAVTYAAAGMSNWVELSTQWSTLRFYSWSDAQLQADPPPPLAGSLPETEPAITRRRADTSSPCQAPS